MTGIIVTGHIHFASGLRSAVEAIAGEQNQISYIDFPPEMATEQLEQALRKAVDQYQQDNEGVIIFTDLAGGSPCNRATSLLNDYPDIRIITGSNLPMVVNACLERDGLTLDELISVILESGQQSIGQISYQSMMETNLPGNKEIQEIADDL